MATIDLLYPAAIPVGHRVEVRWYEAPVGGFFGNKPVVVEHEPRVVDLDTGVEYGPLWMYSAAPGIRPGKPQELSAEPRDGLKEVRVLTGTVRVSRVLTWAAGDGSTFLQTTLVVEES